MSLALCLWDRVLTQLDAVVRCLWFKMPSSLHQLESRRLVSIQTILLNFGPQHPAAHGILKIGLALAGEVVTRADLQFGLLHRGSEKLCESRHYAQIVPYMDRMDYVANLFQEHAAVSSIEGLVTATEVSTEVALVRVVLDELSRILNHLLTMSAVCLDMGAMGPIF